MLPRTLLLLGVLAVTSFDALVDPLWKKLRLPKSDAHVSWAWRLTPALPARWPPTEPKAPVVRYAYAAGLSLGSLHDGEYTSAPFAVVQVAADGTASITSLTNVVEAPAVQGVQPITREEAERQSVDLTEAARAGQLEPLRATWCLYRRYNGVVTRHLEARHAAFFAALACDQKP